MLQPSYNITLLEKQKSFTECIEWFRVTKSKGLAFEQVGPLLRILIAGDLFYAGLIAEPSIEEMGSLIAAANKGAVSGLILLQLLPPKIDDKFKHHPMQVVNAFKLLYNGLQSSMKKVDKKEKWAEMSINAIVLEHSLCKLKRMSKLLGL